MEIRRDFYLDKLIRRKNNGLIKVITGIRRCGKSYLLNNIFYSQMCIRDRHISVPKLPRMECIICFWMKFS